MAAKVVTHANEHMFVALAEMMNEDHLTANEINEYFDLERKYVMASKLAKKREKRLKGRLARIVKVTLGINSLEEFKLMNPKQVEKLFAKRYKAGAFTLETEIEFFKKAQRSRPSYQEVLRGLVGDAGIQKIQEQAPVGYSYTIREAVE